MTTTEHLEKEDLLNIVFKAGTQYVKKEDVSPLGFIKPYTLENVNWYTIKEDIITIQFRDFYMDAEQSPKQHTAKFEMKYINKVYISKI